MLAIVSCSLFGLGLFTLEKLRPNLLDLLVMRRIHQAPLVVPNPPSFSLLKVNHTVRKRETLKHKSNPLLIKECFYIVHPNVIQWITI